MDEASELLSTAQVAEITGWPIGTINRWAKEGRLPIATKVAGRTGANLFRPADVEKLPMATQETSAS